MASQKLFKLKCNGRDFYLLTTENINELELILTDTKSAWKGRVSHKELAAKGKDADVADYETQSRSALTGENASSFEYELKENSNGDGNSRLVWKKVVERESIKFQLGSATLEPFENASTAIAMTFDHLIDMSSSLQKKMVALKLDHDRLAEERATALEKLGSCASIKQDTEQNLYSKFVAVLNEKKAKIRHLKQQLEASQTSAAVTHSAASKSSPNHRKDHRTSESGAESMHTDTATSTHEGKHETTTSDAEYDTDEEACTKRRSTMDNTTVTSSNKSDEDARRNRTTSGGSSSPLSFMLDDLENDDDDEELPVAKRGKKTASASHPKPTESDKDAEKAKKKEAESKKIPCMLSPWTGTTNTSTTSSDRQRHSELPSSSKKESKESHKTSARESSRPIATSRSSDIDDLIGDMA